MFILAFIFSCIAAQLLYESYRVSEGLEYSSYGRQILIKDDRMIVSSSGWPYYDGPWPYFIGAIYIYNINNGNLLFNMTGEAAPDRYGDPIVLNGNYLITSAVGFNSSVGKVYIYNFDTMTLHATVNGPAANVEFGSRITSSGNFLAVSAKKFNNDTGKVYVYSLETFAYQYDLDAEDTGTQFGNELISNEEYLVVQTYGPVDQESKVYTYKWNTTSSIYNCIGDKSLGDFRQVLLIADNYLIIGRRLWDSNRGKIDLYRLDTGHTQYNILGYLYDKYFGTVVKVSGNLLIACSTNTPCRAFELGVSYSLYTLEYTGYEGKDYTSVSDIATNSKYVFISYRRDLYSGLMLIYNHTDGKLIYAKNDTAYYNDRGVVLTATESKFAALSGPTYVSNTTWYPPRFIIVYDIDYNGGDGDGGDGNIKTSAAIKLDSIF